jgi:cytoskeletal protein CcmA (bactofilin family)
MLLRLTILRVHPTCEVVGSLRVRGRAGVNRVPFRGRVDGRPLSAGTYRLLIGARVAQPTAEATIVVARGRVSPARLRKARQANACVPLVGFDPATPYLASITSGGAKGGGSPVVLAGKGVVKKGTSLARRAKGAIQDPELLTSGYLVLVGLLTLAAAALGGFVLVNVYRLRERLLR